MPNKAEAKQIILETQFLKLTGSTLHHLIKLHNHKNSYNNNNNSYNRLDHRCISGISPDKTQRQRAQNQYGDYHTHIGIIPRYGLIIGFFELFATMRTFYHKIYIGYICQNDKSKIKKPPLLLTQESAGAEYTSKNCR